MTQLKLIGLATLVVAFLVSAGFGYVQTQRLETANTKIGTLTSDLESAASANEALVKKVQDVSTQYKEREGIISDFGQEVKELRATIAIKDVQINKYKGRQDIVFAKPKLVERLEQRAMQDFFDKVANK